MPIHVIWGDDYGSSNRAIKNLIDKIVDPAWMSINLSRLDGQDVAQAKQALEEVQTPPLGFGGRVILVKKSSFLNGPSSDMASKLEAVIPQIPENTHLILHNSIKPDKRLKTTKLLQELIKTSKATEKKFLLPPIWDGGGIKLLVEKIASDLNLELEEEATFALIESIGNNSSRLFAELEKLALLEEAKLKEKNLTTQKICISQKSVSELIGGLSTNALEIGNYLLSGRLGDAISRIDSLIDSGEPALRIVATLTSQVRGWLWVSVLEKEGEKDVSLIAKQAGIANPKRIYVMRKQIHGKPTIFFSDLLKKVLQIEALLKKGSNPKNAFRDGLLTKC